MGINESFSGDFYLRIEFEKLIKKFKINNIVETGTFMGDTTKEFSKMAENVYTIESNKKFYLRAKKNLIHCTNVRSFLGDSPIILNRILSILRGNTLFFLDAHWGNHWPILDELKIISKFPHLKNSIIVIHDFYVPGKNFGFDSYYYNSSSNFELFLKRVIGVIGRLLKMRLIEKQRLDYEFVKKSIEGINPLFKYYYNSRAEGANRGVIFIHP
jgi:hypothetical protein